MEEQLLHDLRTPLAVVKGFLSLLDQSWDRFSPDEVRQFLAISLAKVDETATAVERLDAAVTSLHRVSKRGPSRPVSSVKT
jgi:signal transduction histidine kinase